MEARESSVARSVKMLFLRFPRNDAPAAPRSFPDGRAIRAWMPGRCIHRKLKSLMLDQETRYAHWSPVLSTRTRHFLPEGPKCISLGIAGGRRYHFSPAVSSIKEDGPAARIIVINPLRCAKLLPSAPVVCLRSRLMAASNGRRLPSFSTKRDRSLDKYLFWPERDDGGDDLRDKLRLRKGSGLVTFVTRSTVPVARSSSSRELIHSRNLPGSAAFPILSAR